MSRALWPGRGSGRGGPTFSSAPTTAAVPSVNLGPPVGLPPDVLQHILTFVDGRGLAVCEQVCKGMRSTASDKQLYVGGSWGPTWGPVRLLMKLHAWHCLQHPAPHSMAMTHLCALPIACACYLHEAQRWARPWLPPIPNLFPGGEVHFTVTLPSPRASGGLPMHMSAPCTAPVG